MATPAVSVCIPTFNAARDISATVASVLSQTLADFELVICDDASTDDTLKRLEEFKDPRIRIVVNATNTGLAANWNCSGRACRSPYIKLLCQDDLIYPKCLEKQLEILTNPAHSGIALVSARRRPSSTTPARSASAPRPRLVAGGASVGGLGNPKNRPLRNKSARQNPPRSCSALPSLRARAGGFRDTLPYMIDVDFWCRVLRDSKLYSLHETLAAFRLSSTALSATLAHSQSRQARQFFSSLAADPHSHVTKTDAAIGRLKAFLLAPARRLAYRFLT